MLLGVSNLFKNHLVRSVVGEGGEHGDAGTEHRARALQREPVRHPDDEPLGHGVAPSVAAVRPPGVRLHAAVASQDSVVSTNVTCG